MTTPKSPPTPPKLNQDMDIRPFYKLSEHLLKTLRPDVPHLAIFGVPVTEMNTDELQCMVVMAARQADRLGAELFRAREQLAELHNQSNATTTKS